MFSFFQKLLNQKFLNLNQIIQNSNNRKKIMAFHNYILDKSKYITDTFQTSKLQFLTFCEEEPLEVYIKPQKKILLSYFYTLLNCCQEKKNLET